MEFKQILSYWCIKETNNNNNNNNINNRNRVRNNNNIGSNNNNSINNIINNSNNNNNNSGSNISENTNNNSEEEFQQNGIINTTGDISRTNLSTAINNNTSNSNNITSDFNNTINVYDNANQLQLEANTVYKTITTSMENILNDSKINVYSVYKDKIELMDGGESSGDTNDENESVSNYSNYSTTYSFNNDKLVGDSESLSESNISSSLYSVSNNSNNYGSGNSAYSIYNSNNGNNNEIDSNSNYSNSIYGSNNYNSGSSTPYSIYTNDSFNDLTSASQQQQNIEQKLKLEKYYKETRLQEKINNKSRDWNQEFQTLLRLSPSLEKFQKLTFLALDFVKAAENYGYIILKEMFLPNDKKTIKPIDIGGVAGGEKYLCAGLLFKFAYDQKVGDQYLYGGKYPSETSANKAAGNELKSLSTFFQHVLDNEFADKVNVPLMCIIDYFGYRLIAMSVLPINKTTLVYGSSDGGKTVHTDDEDLNLIMEKIGKSMNLRGHLAGINPKFMFGPGDLEVHKSNNQYYVVDFGRLLPPQSYLIENQEKKTEKQGSVRDIFYKMIRPELLKQSYKPLSSDAFSGWGSSDPCCEEYNDDIDNITSRLFNEIIPNAAKELEMDWDRYEKQSTNQIDDFDISIEAHKYGINIRHLGKLRTFIKNPSLRKHILNEMLARVFKNQIKNEQRLHLTGYYVGSEERCIDIIVQFLNRIMGNDKFSTTKDFWTIAVKNLLVEKFGHFGLSESEMDHKFDLLSNANLYQILIKFQNKTGIKLSSRIKSILKKSIDDKKVRLPFFFYTDIIMIRPVVKHSNMVARSEGIALYMKAIELIYANQVYIGKPLNKPDFNRFNSDFSEEISLLEACKQKLCLASKSSTTDSSLYHLLGLVDFEILKMKPFNHSLKNSSRDQLYLSVRYNENPHNLSSLATVLDVCGDIKKSKEIYDKLYDIAVNDVNHQSIIIQLLFESSSLYSPYYTKITNESLLSVAFHQLLVLIEILLNIKNNNNNNNDNSNNNNNNNNNFININNNSVNLNNEEYLFNSLKILSVLILRTAQAKSFDTHKSITKIVCCRNGIEFQHPDIIESTWEYIERSFSYNENILDDFIEESTTSQSNPRISLYILLQYSLRCPSLKKRIIRYIKDKPFNQMNKNSVQEVFANEGIVTTLIETLGIELDYISLKRKYNSFGNQKLLNTINFDNLYLNEETYLNLIQDLSNVSNQIKVLTISGGRYQVPYSEEPLPPIDYSRMNFNQLVRFEISDNEFPTEFLYSILSSSKDSLKEININYYEVPLNCLEILGTFTQLETYHLKTTSPKLSLEFIPSSIKKIILGSPFEKEMQLEPLMKKCKDLVSFKLDDDDIINKQLQVLKDYPVQQLEVSSYLDYMNNNQLSQGVETYWSTSLESFKFFANRPYDEFSTFISKLVNLKYLDIRFNINDQDVNCILLNLLKLQEFKIDSNKYQLLKDEKDGSITNCNKSIKKLLISNVSSPSNNISNIGLIYPSIESLELQYPKNMNDVSFKGMIENLSQLKELSLSCCYDLTDNSIIALSNSHIASTLTYLSIRDFPLSDGSLIKVISSCPQLNQIKIFNSFKRPEIYSYIKRFKPNIILDV